MGDCWRLQSFLIRPRRLGHLLPGGEGSEDDSCQKVHGCAFAVGVVSGRLGDTSFLFSDVFYLLSFAGPFLASLGLRASVGNSWLSRIVSIESLCLDLC
jgi:hypothetical protein